MRQNLGQRDEKRQKRHSHIGRRLMGFFLAIVLLFTSGWSSFATSVSPGTGVVETETGEPVSEAEQPTGENASPVSEAEQPTGEAAQPVSEATQPTGENASPVSEAEQPMGEAVQPVSENEQPANESVQPTSENASPASESAQPASESEQPTSESAQPTSESAQSTSENEPFLTSASQSETVSKVVVTLNLNGGKIDGLETNGWTLTAGLYRQEFEQNQQITISNPNRAGYTFKGWQKAGESLVQHPGDISTALNITKDCQFTAVWEERLYLAKFYDGVNLSTPLWTVRVPYGSVLWTMDENKPWEEANVAWAEIEKDSRLSDSVTKMETAQVIIKLAGASGDTEYRIIVTRYTQTNTDAAAPPQFYYTFTLEDVNYFTYGGHAPERSGYNFADWQADNDGSGYAVTSDEKAFWARYTQGQNYLFHVYYYYENGTKADDPLTIIKSENEVIDGKIQLEFNIPSKQHYTPTMVNLPSGIAISGALPQNGGVVNAVVDKATVFSDETLVNPSVSMIVMYVPSEIDYKVVYHQQKVGEGIDPKTNYDVIGYKTGRAKIGSTVSVEDRPGRLTIPEGNSESDTDFTGFEADLNTQGMIRYGRRLEQSLLDESGTAVIHMYYNRTYYYVYTLIDTNESNPFDPERVQYGAGLPEDKDYSTLKKTGYKFKQWTWYKTGQDGNLELIDNGTKPNGTKPESMPAHDVYTVAEWEKSTTSMQVVYWFEDANSGSFQNTYQKTINDVPTGDRLVLNLVSGNYDLTLENDPTQSFPAFTETFEDAIKSKYGEKNSSYKQYFTFDPEATFYNEDKNHHAVGNAAKTELHYEVKADGTTTINLYYRRNLYTLQFVIQRTKGNTRQVATATNGTLEKNGYALLGSKDSYFHDFTSSKLITMEEGMFNSKFGAANVLKEYRIQDAIERGDSRAAVGRYAAVQIGSYTCFVYYLTARFEADIAELWPTIANITVHPDAYYSNPLQYISMGPNLDSAYWASKTGNKNILNKYSTMDALIVNNKDGIALQDNESTANKTHQMYAYWSNSNVRTYQYYFLYEVLDTTLDPSGYTDFSAENADTYLDGTIVRWKSGTEPYRLYVYRKNNVLQKTTNSIDQQNQPARHGYKSVGKAYKSIGTNGGNVYFFYKRDILTLSIYNVNGNWVPSSELLKKKLTLDYVDEITGVNVVGESESERKSLAELGWVDVDPENELIHLKYGASLNVINQDSVTKAFYEDSKPLENPFSSMGENKSYFYGWYKDQENIVPVDWTVNAMQNMIQDEVLYTGWTTPKYRITYALNGGTWTDQVHMTFMIPQVGTEGVEDTQIVLYYPHSAANTDAQVFWYEPENKSDFLYVRSFYISTIGDLMDISDDGVHYKLKPNTTLKGMIEKSKLVENMAMPYGNTVYLCHTGEDGKDEGDTSHRNYINQHVIAGGELKEPLLPVRNGYDFLGWYAFDKEYENDNKIWLEDVIDVDEGLDAYQNEHVYLDSSGGAHLLYKDATTNKLYYYEHQDGYLYRFQFGASVASQDRTLYATWKGQQVNASRVMHLIPKSEISLQYVDSTWSEITINGTVYYQIEDERHQDIESGTTQIHKAKSLTDLTLSNDGEIWLPENSEIRLEIGEGTPEGRQETDTIYTYTSTDASTVFKVKRKDIDREAYTYYAYFIYHPVKNPSYTVYYIDLMKAVQANVLKNYNDRFDRSSPPLTDAACLAQSCVSKTAAGSIVIENAKIISNYTVYERWTETLHLESNPNNNNIYFYYVMQANNTAYDITYHFMKDGNYDDNNNVVRIKKHPGQIGQQISLDNIVEEYVKLFDTAEAMRGHANSQNQAEQQLYNRFREMTIESSADGVEGSYSVSVAVTDENNTLTLESAKALIKDYVLDSNRSAATVDITLIAGENNIDVFLTDARLTLNKKDSSDKPLGGAEFELRRFKKVHTNESIAPSAEVITYENTQYVRDTGFEIRKSTTDDQGKIIFYDLSTDLNAGYIYQVKEVKAPEGHIPLAEPVYVKVPYQVTDASGTTTHYKVTYDIVNPGITYLPKAGGGGVIALMFGGGGILAGGLLAGEALYGKKGKKRRKTK